MQFPKKLFAEALAYAYVSQPAQFQFWRRLQPHYKKSEDFCEKLLGDFSESFFWENYFLRLICKPLYFAYLHFLIYAEGPFWKIDFFCAPVFVASSARKFFFAPEGTPKKNFFAAALLRLRRCPSRTGTRRRRWVFPLFFFSPLLLQRRRNFFLQAQILWNSMAQTQEGRNFLEFVCFSVKNQSFSNAAH